MTVIVEKYYYTPLPLNLANQGYAAAKSLAALAGKVRLAVAGKFPIIPKGYSGLVEQLLAR